MVSPVRFRPSAPSPFRLRDVRSRSDVPDEDDSIGLVQLVRVQREVAIVGRRVGPQGQIRGHAAESRGEASRLEQVTALREGGKDSLERVRRWGVEPLVWRGTESRALDGVLVAQLRADDRSNAPPLQRQVSQVPFAPSLLQVQVMAKHQSGSPLPLTSEDGIEVV